MTHPLRWLALVALDEPVLPSFDACARWYAARYPDAPSPSPAGATESLQTLALGDLTAAVTLVRRPIPWSQLEGPAATAWYWPEAATALRSHTAHLLVTVVDEGGRAVDKAAALTRWTAAIAANSSASGVFWGPGRLVHPPAAFVDQAARIAADDWPLFLWVDFRIESDGAAGLRLFTTGLDALGVCEIEVDRFHGEAQTLLDAAYNFGHYQLTTGKAIRDGESVGLSDTLEATVRRGPSLLGGDLEVLRLELEGG
jgi:hypothetical protein